MIRNFNNLKNIGNIVIILSITLLTASGYMNIHYSIFNVGMIAVMFVLAVRMLTSVDLKSQRHYIAYWILLIYIVINVMISPTGLTFFDIRYYFVPLVVSILYVLTDNTTELTEKILHALRIVALCEMATILICLIYRYYIIWFFSFLYSPGMLSSIYLELNQGIYSGILGEKGLAAYVMSLGLIVDLAELYDYRGKMRIPKLIEAFLLFAAIMLTSKRVLSLAAFMFFIISMLRVRSRKSVITIIISIAAFVLAIGALLYFVPQASVTITRFIEANDYSTMNGRTVMWKKAFEMFKERPIFGWGLGSYKTVTNMIYNAHNEYIQCLAELGIVGLILYAAVIIPALFQAIKRIIREKSSENYMVLYLLMLTMIYCLTGNPFHEGCEIIPFFLGLSLLKSTKRDEAMEEEEEEDEDEEEGVEEELTGDVQL